MKLYQYGIPSQPQKDKYYFDIATNDEKHQTGSIQNSDGKTWKMYLSNMYVQDKFKNQLGKHYYYGSFQDCVLEAERLLGKELSIVIRSSFLHELGSFL